MASMFWSAFIVGQTPVTLQGRIVNKEQEAVSGAEIFETTSKKITESDARGLFSLELEETDSIFIIIYADGYASQTLLYGLESTDSELLIELEPFTVDVPLVEVDGANTGGFSKRKLHDVEGFGIYASKKTEILPVKDMQVNKSTNNARQLFAGVPGLNVWESDGAGLQMSIGSRGLDPNRMANFNTRQNGYDISADALGYPESYYTPPARAIDRIEIVKGAASLQYGPQFGGLLNFRLREGQVDNPIQVRSANTVGSFGYFDSFNSAEGKLDKVHYFTYYQYRNGDGWRDNSNFDQRTAFATVHYQPSDRLEVKIEGTHMNYLAQQPGGLQDFEFDRNPAQSKRERNWFRVNWNLASLAVDYKINDHTKINTRLFHLRASRSALGVLGPIHRPDPLRARTLISGYYNNWGLESRIMKRYALRGRLSHLLIGGRIYNGRTKNMQGRANDGFGPEFKFLNKQEPEVFSYDFPSRNYAVFAENLFYLTDRWTLTPGLRAEYIRTAADGYYRQEVFSGGELIFEQRIEDQQENSRTFLIFGLGSSFRTNDRNEFYVNFSQNYRSINFTDLMVVNPNLQVDSTMQDERGFNADIGWRGQWGERFQFDVSLFYLNYNNRIGLTEKVVEDELLGQKAVSYRTNIGRAGILGAESFAEYKAPTGLLFGRKWKTSIFTNCSVMKGQYLSGTESVRGNRVEYIPELSIRSGISVETGAFSLSYLIAFTGDQYSDATNAEYVVDATRGIIPAYQVHDLSLGYAHELFDVDLQVNNLLNARYFTRRATAYPGPGIIPAQARSVFLTVEIKLEKLFQQ